MKKRKINFIKLGILLFGVSLIIWNCTFDENINNVIVQNEIKLSNVKTVSFEDAIEHFNSKKNRNNLAFSKSGEDFTVSPDWNTLEYNEIAYTDAELTTANTQINRTGNYSSELFFININGHIKNVIYTIYEDRVDENRKLVDGRIFFNDLDGKFIDGYIIEEAIFTKRFVVQRQNQVHQGGFSIAFLFQETPPCWNTDILDEYEGGVLGEVVVNAITTPGSDEGGGTSEGAGHSDSYNWYYTSGPGGGSYGNYINNATGNTLPSGGGGSSLSSGQITSAAAAILMASPVDPDDEGNCPEGYVLNPTTEECDPICNTGGKIYNTTTDECECPDNTVEDKDGNCIAKPCEGDPVQNPEIAPQYGSSGTKGALHGCTRYGSVCSGLPGGRTKSHIGIDIKAPKNSPIFALFDGIIHSNYTQNNLAGHVTRIRSELPNGEIIIYQYFHLQENSRLSVGTEVRAGDIIAYLGDSGNLKKAVSDGDVDSHVHIKMNLYDGSGNSNDYSTNFKNNPVNPSDYMNTKFDSKGNKIENNCN